MKCAYCGKEAKGTKEHIISSGILDLFPECYITFDDARHIYHENDPMVKDVCSDCNNNKISYIDSYARALISKYFIKQYGEDDQLEVEYNYTMVQKMLLKYAYNDIRSHKGDCSFFDEEIIHYLIDINDDEPKKNVTVMAGLAVNVSPVPDAMFGNLKLRWCYNPIFYSNSTVKFINYETGEVLLNDNNEQEEFPNLKFSYIFKFNSVQFILLCWEKDSDKIEQNNIVLECQYPYSRLGEKGTSTLSCCTDEFNYHHFEHIHVKWDGLFEVGTMRRYASGGNYKNKETYEKQWKEEERRIIEKHPRSRK